MFRCKEDNRRRNGLRQDYLMPQMDIDTSQIDALFIDSSLFKIIRFLCFSLNIIPIFFCTHERLDFPFCTTRIAHLCNMVCAEIGKP